MVFDILVDSSKDETGWWDQHKRRERWLHALSWKEWQWGVLDVLPQWIRYMDFEAGKLVLKWD